MATKILKRGMRGDDVRDLQQKLERLGFDLSDDGIFGEETERAVVRLQTLFGYDVDALVGDGTKKLIDAQIGYGWNAKLPNAQELALRSQGKQPGTEGGTGMGRMSEAQQNVNEVPRSPTVPDAAHTAVPNLAGPTRAPGT
ncbi:MAG: peptidoglycan-binding protein, partial [Myxococcota bacterium]|nr:peptidoglycan-binding protein [Myxococcota bacterium]